MKPTKNSFIIISLGALLITGLFLYSKNKAADTPEISKPSQLDFTDNNEIKAVGTSEALSDKKNGQISADESVDSPKNIADVDAFAPTMDLSRFSEQDKKIWANIEAVLGSNDDNDPRINLELKNLSPNIHEALYEKYASVIPENRNSKGLIVFLIARDLKSKEDIEFITKTYQETPCLSLEDCRNVGSDDAHHAGANQTTLVYPQLAGLYQLEQQLRIRPEILKDPTLRSGIIYLLKQAEDFPVSAVQQKAKEIRRKNNL